MRTLTLLISLLFIRFTHAQVDSTEQPLTYTRVITVDSTVSADELYMRAKRWFMQTFKSGKDVIQIEDRLNHELSGRGLLRAIVKMPNGNKADLGDLWIDVNIYCKQGRYKFVITNARSEGRADYPGFGLLTYRDKPLIGSKKYWYALKGFLGQEAYRILNSAIDYIEDSSTHEDW